MPIKINDLPQCNCGAVFLTDEGLRCHIQENERHASGLNELIRFAYSQLERLQNHSRTQDIDDTADDRPCRKHKDSEGKFHCPSWGCGVTALKPNQLLKHYGRHMLLYNEPPCVCCGKPTTTIGHFLEHAEQHNGYSGDSAAKNEYLPKRCEELSKIRDKQLAQEASKINPLSGPASKRRKRKRAAISIGGTSAAAINRDSLSSQPGSCILSHQNVASSLDAIVPHHGPEVTLSTEPDPQENQNPQHTNSSAILRFERSTHEVQSLPKDPNFELQAVEYAESNNHVMQPYLDSHTLTQHRNQSPPLRSSPPITQATGSGRNSSLLQPNARVNAPHINTLSRLGIGSLTNQSAIFDTNAAMDIMVQSVHSLPVQQQATRYANMNMNNFITPETVYMDFSPVVSTLNFATQ